MFLKWVSWKIELFTLFVGATILLILWLKRRTTYFQRMGIPTPPTTFLLGNMRDSISQKRSFGEETKWQYNYLKAKNKLHGGIYLFWNAVYFPIDPELIKHIMQNDFHHFVDRGVYVNEEDDPLSAHLFSLKGKKWKNLRAKLTPTFTSGKMKMMFGVLLKCGKDFVDEIDRIKHEPIDIKDMLARFTTDIIGSCAFGLECNSMKEPNNEFREKGKKVFDAGIIDNLKGLLTFIMPEFAKSLGMRITNDEVTKFFMKVISDTVKYREKNNIYRKDFMHLLIQLKNKGKLVEDGNLSADKDDDGDVITFNELAAQAFVFFIAGFETSSTTMTFCLFELASNPDIQKKLRQEVLDVLEKYNGELTYDAIMDMHYMEKVVNETLRKYPPLPSLNRECTKDYRIPGTEVILKKGMKLIIPVIGLHHDEDYYPQPEKFDPERFSAENLNRHPYTFLPFGEGPRICIGLRFGMMQTKVGLSVLLKNYEFTVSSKTRLPLVMDPRSFILSTKGGIWLNCQKIE
uniref:Cytochrome P450 CYP6BQ22 n=2 Tax=Dastarcus helophoroides TaxID=1169899 RepID=M9TLT7_9CUCU|nr:cytochrome P450 CYP6BQ22 [Dastarcus helophoroides]